MEVAQSKEASCSAGDLGSIPGLGISPGEGDGYPLQYSCLGNSMDRGAWWLQIMGSKRVRPDRVTNFHFLLGGGGALIAQLVKNPPAMQEIRFDSWVGKIPWRWDRLPTPVFLGFQCGSADKEFSYHAGDPGLIPGWGRSPGEGNGYPLQYSCLGHPMDRVACKDSKGMIKF